MEKVMLGVKDIMSLMGIGRDHAYNLILSKKFPTHKIGRRYLVHKDVFESWLKGEYTHESKKK